METKNITKTWKSKTKGLVSKKPADYMVDKKTVDGQEVFIGDKVRVFDASGCYWGVHRIVETPQGEIRYRDPFPFEEGQKWELA